MAKIKPANPWPGIDPSNLRHLITISQSATDQDSFGQASLSWNDIRTTYGALNTVTQKEVSRDDKSTALATDVWTVRWSPTSITPGMRVTFCGQIWRILVVNNVAARNLVVHLLCMAVDNPS